MIYRHEIKHVISPGDAAAIRANLSAVARIDPHAKERGCYCIRSLYFDDPLDTALHEKLDGVNERRKFRIRYYNDDLSYIMLECKMKRDGVGAKRGESIRGQLDGTIPSTSAAQRNSDALIDASDISTANMGSMNSSKGGGFGGGMPSGGAEGFSMPSGMEMPEGFTPPQDGGTMSDMGTARPSAAARAAARIRTPRPRLPRLPKRPKRRRPTALRPSAPPSRAAAETGIPGADNPRICPAACPSRAQNRRIRPGNGSRPPSRQPCCSSAC